jgi:hypothetical protein
MELIDLFSKLEKGFDAISRSTKIKVHNTLRKQLCKGNHSEISWLEMKKELGLYAIGLTQFSKEKPSTLNQNR